MKYLFQKTPVCRSNVGSPNGESHYIISELQILVSTLQVIEYLSKSEK